MSPTDTRSKSVSKSDSKSDSVTDLDQRLDLFITAQERKFAVYDEKLIHLEEKLTAVVNAGSDATIKAIQLLINVQDTRIARTEQSIADVIAKNSAIQAENAVLNKPAAADEGTLSRIAVLERQCNGLNADINDIYEQLPADNEQAPASSSRVSLASLEARIDKLEDHSRRDNLLFYGFEEQENEQCENKIRDLLARKIFYHDNTVNVNKINIVRAHRLGGFTAGQKRPIIVKFREYSDKQLILQKVFKGKLQNTGKFVGEDFSVNTTNDRKFLREHMIAAREVLDGVIKTSSIRYKAIHITNTKGTRFVFPLHKVEKNPQTWWKVIRGSGEASDDHSSEQYHESPSNEETQDIVEHPAEDATTAPADEVDIP